MPKLNLLVFLNSYGDDRSTNNPDHNGIRWTRDLNGIPCMDAGNTMPFTLAPGESKILFDTTRTLAQDNTTAYSLALSPGTSNNYTLTAVSGTLPNFRAPRVTGADGTTQVVVTTNGPVATFASTGGTYASFTGAIAGMISNITLVADSIGTAGNSILLVADGVSDISTLVANWNTANPSNEVTLTAGNGTQVPDLGLVASFSGTILGTSTPVVIQAVTAGTIGNAVVLIGDGTSSISTLIADWNTANPSNQISLVSGDGTQVPYGGAFASYTGTPAGFTTPVTLTANTLGTIGNGIELVADSVSDLYTLVANWNIDNPLNMVTLSAGNGAQIANTGQFFQLLNGSDPSIVNLDGGTNGDISLSGGTVSTEFSFIGGGVVVGDKVRIGAPFNPLNQGEWKVIAVSATSFSVANPIAVAEGPYTLGSNFASEIQIYGSAGVQVNDTIVISSGFSQVSWGSFVVSAVAANWLQFYTTAILPQEGPITTEIAVYESAKKFVYLEADQLCAITINGVAAGSLMPWVIYNQTKPGQYMLTSTVYSMSVSNSSLNGAQLLFASVE
jgi:hypothetical protein